MAKAPQEEKLFKKEVGVYNQYKQLVAEENTHEHTKAALENLTNEYKKLLEQTRFLTWISGRLEKKLHKANRELTERNAKLEKTVDELITAKAGRSAYAIIYFIAIVLFVLEEFFIEPFIGMFGNSLGYSIMIKLFIVLLLKISEGFIEERIKKKPQGTLLSKSPIPA
ncbi:MAG: hypothetical protein JST48_03610 [Bacteroidetes bacterium]|nr:hypothetical protein [Bacteroidota bacterium]